MSSRVNCRDSVADLQLDGEREYSNLLRTLNKVLFFSDGNEEDDLLKTSRLVPSLYDREPYFQLISNKSAPISEDISYQLLTKKLFSDRIKEEVERIKVLTII